MEESIFNIIPLEVAPISKPPLYKSKYSHSILPTASTFGLKNTKISGASNIGGYIEADKYLISQEFAKSRTLGLPDIKKTVNPKLFLKKSANMSTIRLMGDKSLQSIQADPHRKFTNRDQNRKPSVPKHDQKSLIKINSSKDFILSNTIDVILGSPKNVPKEDENWLNKKDFGQTPKYLEAIKNALQTQHLEKQKTYLNQEQQAEKQRSSLMKQEQIQQIREGLKRKYLQINLQYQSITHKLVNSLHLKAKKQRLERQLQEIQADIKKLNYSYIVLSA